MQKGISRLDQQIAPAELWKSVNIFIAKSTKVPVFTWSSYNLCRDCWSNTWCSLEREIINILRWILSANQRASRTICKALAPLHYNICTPIFIVMTTLQAKCSHPWKLDENMWWYFETRDQTTYICKDSTFDAKIKWVECISIKKHLEYHLTPCQSYLIHNTSRWCCLWNVQQKVRKADITRNVYPSYHCAC